MWPIRKTLTADCLEYKVNGNKYEYTVTQIQVRSLHLTTEQFTPLEHERAHSTCNRLVYTKMKVLHVLSIMEVHACVYQITV